VGESALATGISSRYESLGDTEVYTVQQAAGWLQVSPSKVYEMCRRGELKHGRFGNAIRIHRRSLLAALGSKREEN